MRKPGTLWKNTFWKSKSERCDEIDIQVNTTNIFCLNFSTHHNVSNLTFVERKQKDWKEELMWEQDKTSNKPAVTLAILIRGHKCSNSQIFLKLTLNWGAVRAPWIWLHVWITGRLQLGANTESIETCFTEQEVPPRKGFDFSVHRLSLIHISEPTRPY